VILASDCAISKDGMPLLREVHVNGAVTRLATSVDPELPRQGKGRRYRALEDGTYA
jgi:hypothetical protein